MKKTITVIKNNFFPVFILALIVCLTAGVSYSADDFLPARVKDISDRNYEKALIPLLDNARNSIVISMYSISPGWDNANNPVKLLINDLLEARDRGVSVTLYLNTKFENTKKSDKPGLKNPAFKKLQDAGCLIHYMPYSRRLHDKLIIIDERYVVEGSTNWTISALRSNYESSTLIDSPELASVKLARIKNAITPPVPKEKKSYTPAYTQNLNQNLTIPKILILNKKYFPRMFTKHESRAMDLYLLLLAHSQVTGKEEFSISLEDMALSLDMPGSWSKNSLRRQVIKSLKQLRSQYSLIKGRFFHGRDAFVTLVPVQGDSFIIPTDTIIQLDNPRLTMRLKFFFLMEALLKDQGEDIYSIPQTVLAKRFNINVKSVKASLDDLKGQE